jgi:hypothetical protein
VDDDKMTRAEFKKKFGVTVNKAQIMIYAAEAAQRVEETGGRSVRMKDYEKSLLRQNKKEKKMGLDRSVRGNGG